MISSHVTRKWTDWRIKPRFCPYFFKNSLQLVFRAVAYIYKDKYTLYFNKYNDVKNVHFNMRFVIYFTFWYFLPWIAKLTLVQYYKEKKRKTALYVCVWIYTIDPARETEGVLGVHITTTPPPPVFAKYSPHWHNPKPQIPAPSFLKPLPLFSVLEKNLNSPWMYRYDVKDTFIVRIRVLSKKYCFAEVFIHVSTQSSINLLPRFQCSVPQCNEVNLVPVRPLDSVFWCDVTTPSSAAATPTSSHTALTTWVSLADQIVVYLKGGGGYLIWVCKFPLYWPPLNV